MTTLKNYPQSAITVFIANEPARLHTGIYKGYTRKVHTPSGLQINRDLPLIPE